MAIAYIALGSNLGFAGRAPAETMRAAIKALGMMGKVLAPSSFYETAPVGFKEQPSFTNAVVSLETSLSAESLLDRLLELELEFGRDRTLAIANGPRTLDLDLLMMDQTEMQSARLVLPHPRMADRRFVLQPLAEIAPDLRHPLLGKTIQQLLEELPDDDENSPSAVRRLQF